MRFSGSGSLKFEAQPVSRGDCLARPQLLRFAFQIDRVPFENQQIGSVSKPRQLFRVTSIRRVNYYLAVRLDQTYGQALAPVRCRKSFGVQLRDYSKPAYCIRFDFLDLNRKLLLE